MLTRRCDLLRGRIGHMNRTVEAAVRIVAIKDVIAFGCFVIALLTLIADGTAAESNRISFQSYVRGIESECALRLHDYDSISPGIRRQNLRMDICRSYRHNENCKNEPEGETS
jgi:hypothetical protein